MSELILDAVIDTLKTLPFLFGVYFLLEFMHTKLPNLQQKLRKAEKFGPAVGAAAGCIPQCGFSVVASSLYSAGAIGAGTLVAVFIATSDEAIPILMAHSDFLPYMAALIICKLILAVVFGYIVKLTVFKNEELTYNCTDNSDTAHHCHDCGHEHSDGVFSIVKCAFSHTVKTALYLLISIAVINLAVFAIGEENLSSILLKGSIFQPALAALIGLVPGCSTSVLLTELFISSNISFASAVAGLSSGAGFGFLVLFREVSDKKKLFKIILSVYVSAAVGGMLIHILSSLAGIGV